MTFRQAALAAALALASASLGACRREASPGSAATAAPGGTERGAGGDGATSAAPGGDASGAATPGAAGDDAARAAAPGDQPPGPLPLATAVAVAAGAETPLDPGATALVDPAASFRVELPVELPDARMLLLDAGEDIVPATGATELGGHTRFTLTPAEPLRPGSTYTLRVDGAVTREAHDASGRVYLPLTLPLKTTGEPPPPPPARKRRR